MKMKKIICCMMTVLCVLVTSAAQADGIKLFIGQDVGAVEGYTEHFPMPAGITSYTSLPWLSGLYSPANWGSGDVHAQKYVDDPAFDGVALALGLYLVGETENMDSLMMKIGLLRLGEFIKQSERTVYLRIGYEFDGAWNGYPPESYITAFQTIVDTLRQMEVGNFKTVWQSSGNGSAETLLKWYPGDDYVDWMGYSYFNGSPTLTGKGILDLARQKNKPVFICEAAHRRDAKTMKADLLWKAWYEPLFEHMRENSDVIQAISYINCDWESQPMWQGQRWGDSRLEANEALADKWRQQLDSGLFIMR